MYISFMSMNRMVEERAAKDDAFRRILERNGRPLLSHGRGMSDDALAAKLRSLGFDADRQHLLNVFRRSISAEAVARAMLDSARPPVPESEKDWVWIALTCLWERWLPEVASTEIGRFSDGYLPIENFKTGLAESHFELGEREVGDRLFRRWLDDRPQWNEGWIAWSDCYWTFAHQSNKDAEKAEHILKEGLATPGIEDRRFMLERLAGLYDETGRPELAGAV